MSKMEKELIAPCGMNCRLCMAYQRVKNHCNGCWDDSGYKAKSCSGCIIKNCPTIKSNKSGFCYDCENYPCKRLIQLDKRYTTKYNMSMLENLQHIKEYGMKSFLKNEEKKWTCKQCGNIICVHKSICFRCNSPVVKNSMDAKETKNEEFI